MLFSRGRVWPKQWCFSQPYSSMRQMRKWENAVSWLFSWRASSVDESILSLRFPWEWISQLDQEGRKPGSQAHVVDLLSVSEWFLVCVKAGRPSHLFPQSGGSNFDHVTRVDSVGSIGHSANLTAITYWSMKVGSVSLFFGAWKSKSLMHLLMELLLQRIILKNYNICFLLSRLEGGMKERDLSALYDLEGGLLLSPVGARVLSYWFMRIYFFFFFFDLGCSVPFTDRGEDEGSWLA